MVDDKGTDQSDTMSQKASTHVGVLDLESLPQQPYERSCLFVFLCDHLCAHRQVIHVVTHTLRQ